MFCDAIVTMNSGRAIPAMACRLKAGTVRTGAGRNPPSSFPAPPMDSSRAMTARATASEAGTDHRGANFTISSQQMMTGAT